MRLVRAHAQCCVRTCAYSASEKRDTLPRVQNQKGVKRHFKALKKVYFLVCGFALYYF